MLSHLPACVGGLKLASTIVKRPEAALLLINRLTFCTAVCLGIGLRARKCESSHVGCIICNAATTIPCSL